MGTILEYFKNVKAQRQLNRLARKCKNKRVVIYGAGEYFKILKDNFDLSKLNIVGIADKKFETNKPANFTEYTPLAPEELKDYDYDIILVALYDDVSLIDYLEYQLLIGTKNEDKKILSIIEPTLWYIIKTLLSK